MRAVDERWPAPGSKLHHSAGVWPAVVNDETLVLDSERPRRLRMQARGWPAGEATVELRIDAGRRRLEADHRRGRDARPGPVRAGGVRQPAIALRNSETLRRLAYMAERGAADARTGAGSAASLPKEARVDAERSTRTSTQRPDRSAIARLDTPEASGAGRLSSTGSNARRLIMVNEIA